MYIVQAALFQIINYDHKQDRVSSRKCLDGPVIVINLRLVKNALPLTQKLKYFKLAKNDKSNKLSYQKY